MLSRKAPRFSVPQVTGGARPATGGSRQQRGGPPLCDDRMLGAWGSTTCFARGWATFYGCAGQRDTRRGAVRHRLAVVAIGAIGRARRDSVALLIGNQAYGSKIGGLNNPHNDVALLERALRGLGFEVLSRARRRPWPRCTRAVNAYARRLAWRGHGRRSDSSTIRDMGRLTADTSYLIPST